MAKRKKRIVILMGVPGSGKGTQSVLMTKENGFRHISTGELLRKMVSSSEKKTPEQEKIMEYIKEGKMLPDDFVYQMAFAEIEKSLKEYDGIILDGATRNLGQAQKYWEFFKEKKMDKQVQVIEIYISDDTIVERLTKRKICSVCGSSITSLENLDSPTCMECGGKMVTRPDDNLDTIKKRIQTQGNRAIRPILDFYLSKTGVLSVVDGEQSIQEVHKQVMDVWGKK